MSLLSLLKSPVKTWHIEILTVAALLGIAAYVQHVWIAALSGLAVLGSFGHAQIAERMRERQAVKQTADVHCHRLLTGYLISKELAWIAFFLLTKSWPALVGCGIFLAYPIWRKWWRKYHQMDRNI